MKRNPNHSGSIQHGYRSVMLNGVRKKEHRMVMERVLGRKLLRSEVVHHRNGDKLDNRPENLELVKGQSEHLRNHWEKENGKAKSGLARMNSKLSIDEVIKIRSLFSTGRYTKKQLASMFGIHQAALGYVIRRKTWNWVP